MGHGVSESRDDCPTASSMGFGASTTTTRSLGVSGFEADDDDDEVELVSENQKTEKDPTKITRKCVCNVYIYIYIHPKICFCAFDIFSVWLQGNLRKINVERAPPFKPWKLISILVCIMYVIYAYACVLWCFSQQ